MKFYSKSDKKKNNLSCSVCGSIYVVNRTHSLCHEHNQERLHGKNWKEDKIKRYKPLSKKKLTEYKKHKKLKHNSIKQLSRSQSRINNDLKKVYAKINNERLPKCESCGAWHTIFPLSHSHIISVDRCKKIGRLDLITDERNILLECFEPPTSNPSRCHNKHELGFDTMKDSLKFDYKIQFIKENDPEMYQEFLFWSENK